MRNALTMPMKWPTGAGDELAAPVGRLETGRLAGLEAEGLVAVDDALEIAGGARAEGDPERADHAGRERELRRLTV